MNETTNKYLISALLLGLVFHGSAIFFTLESTYDALIHLFFADHYANSWFEPWNYKWYTGFTVQGYPPLVHQSIALFSYIGGLKFGLFTVALIAIVLFITGVYRFSKLITSNKTVAGYAALLSVFSSSFVETLHIFGQLPSIVGISVLMHALPEIYLWLKNGKYWHLATSLSLISVTVTSHHVTPIFGMVFFIFPVIGMVLMDLSREKAGNIQAVTFRLFLSRFFASFWRIISFGFLSLVLIIGCILPYWINSKANPITQVPIPHGSRDNFLEVTSSGLVFFLIPWGVLLILLPYIFYRYYSRRYLFFGLSITICTILGTGGTTPIPKAVLGETAFNILTLDRFTLWASILSLPLLGEFAYRFVEGDLKEQIQNKFGSVYHRVIGGILAGLTVFMVIFTMSLGYFRPSQPQKIKMLPIVNFLNQDEHDKWRFLTLGFGDQMAWLSAQTNGKSVDGNYHSARRLPELTTRPVERLENSKFKGVAGIGSLQQFLTTPEKYNLKYIFSNDKFYDPILYFCGWQRLRQLENGIMVWERLNVPPMSSILPKEDVAKWLKIMWGIIPVCTVLIAFFLNVQMMLVNGLKTRRKKTPDFLRYSLNYTRFSPLIFGLTHIWSFVLAAIVLFGIYIFYLKNDSQRTPENALIAYYDALDFKEFEKAYALIDPNSNLPLAQYMLEISVTDGLLSSYAKMDAIQTQIKQQTDSSATAIVRTQWITPLEKIQKTDYKKLYKRKGNWYLLPDEPNHDLPPDQRYSENETNYFNQGKRRTTVEKTHHEDLIRPSALKVRSAKLISYENHYALVGEIQNLGNLPTDVRLKGTLYTDSNIELATYNAKYHVKHKLMPKETSSFRIDFEGIAWVEIGDSIPDTFDPDAFTPAKFEERPTQFNLQVAGIATGSDLYKKVAISALRVHPEGIRGTLFNSGVQEVTIPQLLVSYYDKNKNLVWVDHLFLKDGIRQQRKQHFAYSFLKNGDVDVINDGMQNVFVNGQPNGLVASRILPNGSNVSANGEIQKIEHPHFGFIKVELNTYIGSPQ